MTDGAGRGFADGPRDRTDAPRQRAVDVLLLGATGITGRIALAYLTERTRSTGQSFAVGARNRDRVTRLCREAGLPVPDVVEVDVSDPASLAAFAPRGRVLVNLVGPYTPHGPTVIAACVTAGTSYVDLTGETPFIRRTDARWHEAAIDGGVAIVQTAGFESLPVDLAVDLARATLQRSGHRLAAAEVSIAVHPAPGAGPSDMVSGGTMQSILQVLADSDAPRLSDVAFRVTEAGDAATVRSSSPLRLWPRVARGTVLAPMSPAAFINPPVLHRTAWLAAAGEARPFRPLHYREGIPLGPFRGARGAAALAGAYAAALSQGAMLVAARCPRRVRGALAALLGRMLPAGGTGPQGPALDDWRWELTARGVSDARTAVEVHLEADGHPGYSTTARMISELALLIADGSGTGRTGCITPALAVGADAIPRFAAAGMRFSVGPRA
ncbi:saccharopine dehydrogenase NADP-binding domain-containing protein [Planctomonas psychrotolerans]|uniref:saccharopine dehydrogenase NADP-binding domain-containing protein n=1 Tax=Planctomonas psychrotolerans TaxID=2528712 RepID=UPI001239D459|nr:saccharopine dehydrogenase NADP-binding domain-containing protein [Planctomonas psychrotolerans]